MAKVASRNEIVCFFDDKSTQVEPGELNAFGIKIESRYGKAGEIIDMLKFSELAAKSSVAHYVKSVFYDSNACICNFEFNSYLKIGDPAEKLLKKAALLSIGQFDWFDCILHGPNDDGTLSKFTQIELLKTSSKLEVMEFIRGRLRFSEDLSSQLRYCNDNFNYEHLRFEMSGYETVTGACTLHNQMLLNRFADLGIYDYTEFIFLDFYKGCGSLYLQYLGVPAPVKINFQGDGTTEIIYEVLNHTILSNRQERRRN